MRYDLYIYIYVVRRRRVNDYQQFYAKRFVLSTEMARTNAPTYRCTGMSVGYVNKNNWGNTNVKWKCMISVRWAPDRTQLGQW